MSSDIFTDDELRLDGGEWQWKNGIATWVPHPPPPPPEPNRCPDCSTVISTGANRCRSCAAKALSLNPPAKPKPLKHGEYSGYVGHRRQHIPMCEPCREAGRAYNKARRREARKEAA